MKKGLGIVILLIFSMFFVSTANESGCIPAWKCGEWSECMGGQEIRTCWDVNLCGNLDEKPIEKRVCETCTPIWSCTEWEPEVCPREGRMERICTDLNNCQKSTGMPVEIKECVPETINWIYLLIILIIFLLNLVNVMFIVKRWKKMKADSDKNIFRPPSN